MDLSNAVCYDCETFPDIFTLTAEMLHSDVRSTWEISHYRDDRFALMQWLTWLQSTQTPMIGFFNLKFDYPLLHYIFTHPNTTVEQIYERSRALADNFHDWSNVIWERDRFTPQIDLFSIHHFDNKAKGTSLKALEINMRAPNVMDCPLPFGQPVGAQNVQMLIDYNVNDVIETKRFAHYSLPAINFRIGLIGKLGTHPLEPLNYNDVKIGAKMFEERLGDDVCYDRSSGRKAKRQTPRYRIALADIIFPYIHFTHPEFQRILDFMCGQILTPDDLDDPDASIKTKGVFTGVTANVGGLTFVFGTGGMHASVERQRFAAGDGWEIHDIDVKALYPSISQVNGLAPEHLGDAFRIAYPQISAERDLYAKGTMENASLKLANNGPWGQSNNKHSVFLDPKYAMTIPINGQLMICMLAERLATVPTLQMIQVNTDGITYRIHNTMIEHAREIERQWQDYTCLKLEYAEYRRMWIRDVNNYVAEGTLPRVHNIRAGTAPDDAIYCGRGSPYGNPFIIGQHGDRDLVCDRFEREILPTLDVAKLKGRDLVCHCAPERCHCDPIIIKANGPAKLKQKGAYWHPDPLDYANSISNASPPCWYKDFNPVVVQRAAVAAMVQGIDPDTFIRAHSDPFDFMCRVKADRSAQLLLGGIPIQGTTRYYVATNGSNMTIVRPPPAGHNIGEWKRAPRITKAEYDRVMGETGGIWDERVCTKSKTKYGNTETAIQAGWKIAECNDARSFRFDNVNHDWYVGEAKKLIIG